MKKVFFSIIISSFILTLFSPILLATNIATTPSNIPISELESYISTYTDQYIGKTTPGASIVVVHDNQVVHEKGYGYTSTANDTSVDASTTIYEWASISKLFVWVSALQLVEQSKLDLNAPISSYLSTSEMPKLQYEEPITMLHLMNHNAGFEDYILNLLSDTKETVKPLPEILASNQPFQVYRPGDIVAYSNYSTSLAAYIIEKITNQSYEDYIKQHIFTPLAMNNTIVTIANDADLAKIESNRATGYVLSSEGEFSEIGHSYLSLYPSGAINGTATDLAKFAQALLAKTEESNLLFNSLDTLSLLFSTTYSPAPHTPGIAHGFWEYQGTYKSYTHAGNTMGFSTNFHVVPEASFAAIVLTNQVGEIDISYGLMESLLTNTSEELSGIPLNQNLNYDKTFMTSRNTNHSFSKIYYHTLPLTIEPNYEQNELVVHFLGDSARYVQITENEFQLVENINSFLSMKHIHLNVEGTNISSIYVPYASFIPMSISTASIYLSFAALILLALYMLVMTIVYTVKAKQSKKQLRGYALAMLLQIVVLTNTAILIYRLLLDSYRSTDELQLQIFISHSFGILTLFALIYLLYKAIQTRGWFSFHFAATVLSIILFQCIMIYWRFYSF